tara:strand:+ start:159 stop:527 length:369 start_codon:yes stop_codon:yes gene_type:complete
MGFELECRQRLDEQFFQTEEEKVERFFQPSLSIESTKRIYSSNFIAASLTNKFGVFISTPKSVFPKAVDRNKIKRRIKSIIFDVGFDASLSGIRLIVRKDFLALNYKEAYNEIDGVIKKAFL